MSSISAPAEGRRFRGRAPRLKQRDLKSLRTRYLCGAYSLRQLAAAFQISKSWVWVLTKDLRDSRAVRPAPAASNL